MSLTPNARRRQAFLWGRQAALRSTNDVVDQLQAELHAEREQHAFDVAELEKQIATLLRDLMQAKYELARRNLADKFINTPSPSPSVH
jgi:multidrug resistance efflux pump